MKKLIIFLLIVSAFTVKAQDSAYSITNVTLKAQDWAFLAAHIQSDLTDTTTLDFIDQLRLKVKALPQGTGWNANVTVDSMPAKLLMKAYRLYSEGHTAITGQLGNNIYTVVNAITVEPFKSQVIAYNARMVTLFNERRNVGRRYLTGK
jgi:hypothetical protein